MKVKEILQKFDSILYSITDLHFFKPAIGRAPQERENTELHNAYTRQTPDLIPPPS